MRLVSREIDAVLKRPVSVNFGLYFNKFLEYGRDFLPVGKQTPLRQYQSIYKRTAEMVNDSLCQRHLRQSAFCNEVRNHGYSVFIFHVRLQTPYISGLGMSHPTETGMVFDHTLGVPYIPAAGQKGLLRLAYMLNELKDDDGNWLLLDQLDVDEKGNPCWHEDDLSRALFGFSDKQDALAGRLVILDAYPLSQPELAEDILNPHYGDYYGSQGKKRGPTEDQSPVPVKFLVLKPGQEFVFRFLLRHGFEKVPSSNIEVMLVKIKEAMRTALTEEGFGAKTALGYGRFEIISEDNEPEKVQKWFEKGQDEKYPWRPLLRKIEKIDNWGEFELKVINSKWGKVLVELELDIEKIDSFREEKEFAEGVGKKALKIAQKNLTKWTEERDKLVADWLAPSPVDWKSPLVATVPEVAPPEASANDLVKTIAELADWSAYQQAGLEIPALDKSCAQALMKKFVEWNCKKSRNENKKKAFKQLNNRLKKLK